jgi:broad specificity phosphatase PhoE
MGCSSSSAPKKYEQKFTQTIVILRHSERLDHVLGDDYKSTPQGKAWPFDTPLTDKGIQIAKETAKALAQVHHRANFACVVSSPYHRCMQTAAEVCHLLNLPMMIDQEMGEVWEEQMPSDKPPHRSPVQLKEMAKELGLTVKNPDLPEGGYKLFGKPPQKHPESVSDGHKRHLVRVQYYIEQSSKTQQNFLICSHAPAVAALADIFNRGNVNIEKLEYCAYVVADRKAKETTSTKASGADVYKDEWDVEANGVNFELNIDATEEEHAKACEDVQTNVQKRKENRTKTDAMADQALKDLLAKVGDDDEEEDK